MAEEGTLTTTDAPPANWKDSVAKEIRFTAEGNDKLSKFNDGATVPIDIVKSYIEMEKISSGKVKIPDENSTPEERSSFYDKIGRPKTASPTSPEGYDVKISEGTKVDEQFLTTMANSAHKYGASKELFQGLVEDFLGYQNQQLEATRIAGETALKGEWKDSYDKNIEITQRAYQAFDTDGEFGKLMTDSMLGNDPRVVKMFFRIGQKMVDDTLVQGQQRTEKQEEYRPTHPNSPEMYRNDESEDGRKARAYFEAHGFKY